MKPWTREERLRVLSVMRGDLLAREWAAIMRVSVHTIHSDVRALTGTDTALVKSLMQSAGVDVHALAERLGLTVSTVYQWRNGHQPIPPAHLKRLAQMAGVTLTTPRTS